MNFGISLAIRPFFFCFFSFQNNPKNLDVSIKTDLDLWDCLGRLDSYYSKISGNDLVICSHSREVKTYLIAK